MLFLYLFDTVASMFRSQKNVIPNFYFAVFHFIIYIKSTYIQYFVVHYITKYVCYITLVNCMIIFRYLLYLIFYLIFKYNHTYSWYLDKLRISNVDRLHMKISYSIISQENAVCSLYVLSHTFSSTTQGC